MSDATTTSTSRETPDSGTSHRPRGTVAEGVAADGSVATVHELDDPPDRRLVPLTPAGFVVAVVTVASYVLATWLDWVEFAVVAAGGLVALAVAVGFVVGRSRLDIQRSVEPQRVMRGEAARATLTARSRDAPSRGVRVDDRIADESVSIHVPAMGPRSVHEERYALPTERRRAVRIGPAAVIKRDPLDLMRRSVGHAPATTLWVHPRWRLLSPLASGFAKDLEGPTTDSSPAGDLAFHALREYQVGDDLRHIHWLSTARAGTPMVRHYVDNRRPVVGVLLDDDPQCYDAEQFDLAVDVVASLLLSARAYDLPSIGRTSRTWLDSRVRPATRDELLERLTVVEPRDRRASDPSGGDLASAGLELVTLERAISAVVVVTGGRPGRSLLPTVSRISSRARVVVVAVGGSIAADPPVTRLPRATVIAVNDLVELERAWSRLAGR